MNDQKNRTPGSIGGETLIRIGVSAALLTLTACGAGSDRDEDVQGLDALEVGAAQSEELDAIVDVTQTSAGSPVIVSVVQDDTLAADAQFALIGQPVNGSATLLSDGTVEYTADADFEGTDIIEYVILDADGNRNYGKFYVAVVCADCNPTDHATADTSEYPYCLSSNADPDGDGYGWENNQSCLVPQVGAALGPLTAKADLVEINSGETQTVTPLQNDTIADRSNVAFSIDTGPTAGKIEAVDSGVIVYSAPVDYSGTDSMVYSITDSNGDTSVANINFNITCDSCVDYKAVKVTWAANPSSEQVEGYKVLFGSDENPLTSTEISTLPVASGDTPTLTLDLAADLNLETNEGGCFMIQAYRGTEVSEASEAACFSRGS